MNSAGRFLQAIPCQIHALLVCSSTAKTRHSEQPLGIDKNLVNTKATDGGQKTTTTLVVSGRRVEHTPFRKNLVHSLSTLSIAPSSLNIPNNIHQRIDSMQKIPSTIRSTSLQLHIKVPNHKVIMPREIPT